MASFAMSYAMDDLGWKFYFINASWNIIFFVVAYFLFIETNGVPLEEIALKFDGPTALSASVVEESATTTTATGESASSDIKGIEK